MANAAVMEWTDKKNTAWMDGSRLENKELDAWQEGAREGTPPHQEHGPYGKESGGGHPTIHTWDKGFGNKLTPSSRKPNTTDGPGRDTISGQT